MVRKRLKARIPNLTSTQGGLAVPTPPGVRIIDTIQAKLLLEGALGIALPEDIYGKLSIPGRMKHAKLGSAGLEFYDLASTRPAPWIEGEGFESIITWVNAWYLSILQKEGLMMGRIIDLEHPNEVRHRTMERIMQDPKRIEIFNVEAFAMALDYRY